MQYIRFIFSGLLFGICSATLAASNLTSLNLKHYKPYDSTLVHVITVDPTRVKIIAARAQDMGMGLATVQDMGKHFSALAAVNGGYFRVTSGANNIGVPAGVLKINQHWHGIAYKSRGAVGWDPKRNVVLMDILQTETDLQVNGKKMPMHAMNKLLNGNKATLLSDSYADNIDITQSTALLMSNKKIQQIYTNSSFTLAPGAYAYNISGTLQSQVSDLKPGDKFSLQIKVLPQLNKANSKIWDNLPYIVGGGPLLISNGRVITDYAREKLNQDFLHSYNARTAIGLLKDNKWVLVVAEGGMLQETRGLTITELAQFMHSLGCVYAVNLDGGSSSDMYVNESIRPTEQAERETNFLALGRPVADAILVLDR